MVHGVLIKINNKIYGTDMAIIQGPSLTKNIATNVKSDLKGLRAQTHIHCVHAN